MTKPHRIQWLIFLGFAETHLLGDLGIFIVDVFFAKVLRLE